MTTTSFTSISTPTMTRTMIAARRVLAGAHRLRTTGSRRGYATPLNKRSSLEPALGTAPPLPPSAAGASGSAAADGERERAQDAQSSRRERWLRDIAGAGRTGGGRAEGSGYPANLQRAKEALIKAPSQPVPAASAERSRAQTQTAAGQHPSTPNLRGRILDAARKLVSQNHAASAGQASTSASIEHLRELYNTRAGRQLSIELPYESTPGSDRRVPGTTETPAASASTSNPTNNEHDDGVLLLAYVSNLHPDRIGAENLSLCSAFPIAINASDLDPVEDEPHGLGPLAISCAHTLTSALGNADSQSSTATTTSSVALAMTRSGHVYTVRTLLSSVPGSDIILLQLSERPVLGSDTATAKLRTLPLSPYPAHPGETIMVSSFDGWDAPPSRAEAAKSFSGGAYDAADGRGHEREQRASASASGAARQLESRWGRASIIEYKDGAGREARVGTYDDLHQLDFRLLSAPAHLRPKIAGVTVPMPSFAPEPPQPAADADDDAPLGFFTSRSPQRDGMQMLERSLERLSKPIESERRRLPTDVPAANAPPKVAPAFPPPGSSGGPIVSVRDGCVVGVVRGSRTSVLEGHRGDGVPAEKIFEMFSLPGLGKKKLEARKKKSSSAEDKKQPLSAVDLPKRP